LFFEPNKSANAAEVFSFCYRQAFDKPVAVPNLFKGCEREHPDSQKHSVENVVGSSRYDWYIDFDSNERKKACQTPRDQLPDVPVYMNERPRPDGTLDLVFYVFFAFNDSTYGKHSADWEHVTVNVCRERKRVLRVYFAAHGSEGRWYRPDELRFVGNRVVVFCALDTHAMYPRSGRIKRFCGLLNDECEMAICWKPKQILPAICPDRQKELRSPTTGWCWYKGFMGSRYFKQSLLLRLLPETPFLKWGRLLGYDRTSKSESSVRNFLVGDRFRNGEEESRETLYYVKKIIRSIF